MTSNKPIRVYADGVYDMFHFGHAQQLEQCKKLFPNVHLIVGVAGDEDCIKYKGPTIMTEEERAKCVLHCKWVDEVVVPCPWIITQEFMDKHKIDYVAHDEAPYTMGAGDQDDIYGFVKKQGKFKATQRTPGISTSDLVNRLLLDSDNYILRNLNRGEHRSKMGVSWVGEKWLKIKSTFGCVKRFRGKEKTN